MSGLLWRLEYALVTDGWEITFDHPPRLPVAGPGFEGVLDDDVLVVETADRFATEAGARGPVEAFLRSWEIDVLLAQGGAEFEFRFRSAGVSDRDGTGATPPGGVRVSQVAVEVLIGKPPSRPTYLPPPVDFVASPDVIKMWHRWRAHRAGREGLSSVANFCLTEVIAAAPPGGGAPRDRAAKALGLTPPILSKLGYLAAKRGTDLDARKTGAVPYSPPERRWVETVVPTIVRRSGQVAAGVAPKLLTMADLPDLTA